MLAVQLGDALHDTDIVTGQLLNPLVFIFKALRVSCDYNVDDDDDDNDNYHDDNNVNDNREILPISRLLRRCLKENLYRVSLHFFLLLK